MRLPQVVVYDTGEHGIVVKTLDGVGILVAVVRQALQKDASSLPFRLQPLHSLVRMLVILLGHLLLGNVNWRGSVALLTILHGLEQVVVVEGAVLVVVVHRKVSVL